MKHILPQKSLFGFKVLNSNHSIIAAYLLLIVCILIKPFFGIEKSIEIIAALFFILISNASLMILILNSIFQRSRSNLYPWLFYNLPLWIYFPFILNDTFKALNILYNIFNKMSSKLLIV